VLDCGGHAACEHLLRREAWRKAPGGKTEGHFAVVWGGVESVWRANRGGGRFEVVVVKTNEARIYDGRPREERNTQPISVVALSVDLTIEAFV